MTVGLNLGPGAREGNQSYHTQPWPWLCIQHEDYACAWLPRSLEVCWVLLKQFGRLCSLKYSLENFSAFHIIYLNTCKNFFFVRDIRENQEYVRSGIPRARKCGKQGHVFLLFAFSLVFCCYVRKELIGTGDEWLSVYCVWGSMLWSGNSILSHSRTPLIRYTEGVKESVRINLVSVLSGFNLEKM